MSTGLISDLLNIQPQTSTPAGSMQVKMLPREYIMRNPDNKIYVVGDIDKLKEDIRLNGVRQPLEVIRWANGYKLIGGERRLTACEELAKEGDDRFSSLPCMPPRTGTRTPSRTSRRPIFCLRKRPSCLPMLSISTPA